MLTPASRASSDFSMAFMISSHFSVGYTLRKIQHRLWPRPVPARGGRWRPRAQRRALSAQRCSRCLQSALPFCSLHAPNESRRPRHSWRNCVSTRSQSVASVPRRFELQPHPPAPRHLLRPIIVEGKQHLPAVLSFIRQ